MSVASSVLAELVVPLVTAQFPMQKLCRRWQALPHHGLETVPHANGARGGLGIIAASAP
jgi:hypothetical protein